MEVLKDASSVLILGDGNGRFLESFLKFNVKAKIDSLSPEEKAALKGKRKELVEKWRSLSPEERKALKEEWKAKKAGNQKIRIILNLAIVCMSDYFELITHTHNFDSLN